MQILKINMYVITQWSLSFSVRSVDLSSLIMICLKKQNINSTDMKQYKKLKGCSSS